MCGVDYLIFLALCAVAAVAFVNRKMLISWKRNKNKSTIGQYVEAFVIIIPIAFLIRTWGYGLFHVPSCSMETTMLVGERFIADKLSILFSPPKPGEIITFNQPGGKYRVWKRNAGNMYPYSESTFIDWFERYIWGPDNWTKRVIGVPGDHLKGVIEDGKPVVYRNGQKLDEPYVNKYPVVYTLSKKPMSMMDMLQSGSGGEMHFDVKSFDDKLPFDKQPFYRINELDVRRAARVRESHGIPGTVYPGTPISTLGLSGSDEFDVHLGKNQYWLMGDNRLCSYDSRAWGPLDGKLIHGKILFRVFSCDTNASWWILDPVLHPIDFWKRVRWGRCFGRVR